jgi:hypothetical protein
VTDGELTIKLARDQAFVLSDWLDRMMGTPAFDSLVNEGSRGLVAAAHDRCNVG